MSEAASDRAKRAYSGASHRLNRMIWGDHVHLGVFAHAGEALAQAQARANDLMMSDLVLGHGDEALEVGCGLGETALALAGRLGGRVLATDISADNVAHVAWRAQALGLAGRVTSAVADFTSLNLADGRFALWWCQDALMMTSHKEQALAEAARVVRAGGTIVFSDVTIDPATPPDTRAEILGRRMSGDVWSTGQYLNALERLGLAILRMDDWSAHLAPSYEAVLARLEANRVEAEAIAGADRVTDAAQRYALWIQTGRAGWSGWIHIRARKS